MHTKSLIKWLTGAGFLAAWVVLSILTGPEHDSEALAPRVEAQEDPLPADTRQASAAPADPKPADAKAETTPYPVPPELMGVDFTKQSETEAMAKSHGCLQCHQNSHDPHKQPGRPLSFHLGCTDCHGGNADCVDKNLAHINPRFPNVFYSSANPVRSYTALNHENPEFIRFVNPGDLRIAHISCGASGCHAKENLEVHKSMMTHGCMLWGAALYNNGAVPNKWPKYGESYSMNGTAQRIQTVPPPTPEETATKGVLPYLDPLPRFNVTQPSNVLRIFERGGRFAPEVGIPERTEEPGRPRQRSSNRGLGTLNRTDPVFVGLEKTRLFDPTLNFLGTNDHPGDYRSSGCTSCHMIYANDRSPVHSGPWAKYGNKGKAAATPDDLIEAIDPTIPKDEPGHPVGHRFVTGVPTSQCIVCHIHPGTTVMNSYLGYMWWDMETDGDLIYPKEEKDPTSEEFTQAQMQDPNEIVARSNLTNPEFLDNLVSLNPEARKTHFSDFHGHGWAFKAVFKKDRFGNHLDHQGNIIPEPTAEDRQRAVNFPMQARKVHRNIDEKTMAQVEKMEEDLLRLQQGSPVHMLDIHLEKGMHCVDCHFIQDVHGNGKLYGEVRAAIEIACEDCHGTTDKHAVRFFNGIPKLLTSGPAAKERPDPYPNGRDLTNMKTPFGKRRFEVRDDKIVQNSMVEPDLSWEVKQVVDTVDPKHRHYNALSALAKTIRRDENGQTIWGSVPEKETQCAHSNEHMSCIACHSSWNPSCYGCHLPQKANKKLPALHNEGDVTRNYVSYNFQTLREDIYMLAKDGNVTNNRIGPSRSSCAIHVTSYNANREAIYQQQQTISADGLSGIAFSTNVPHTVRGKGETKNCTDCHLSIQNDNNAQMAQLMMHGTNFMNFIGRFCWVGAGEEGLHAVIVSEREEPQTVIGSTMHEIVYPEKYEEHVEKDYELEADEHPGKDISDGVLHPRLTPEILSLQLRGEFLYAACGDAGFRIFDVSFIENKGFSERVTTAPVSPIGQKFYVRTPFATSVTAPTTVAPDPTRKQKPENCEQDVHPVYAYIYGTDLELGLVMIGAGSLLDGNPLNNFVKADVQFNPNGLLNGAQSVTIVGTYAYVCCPKGLVVVDINDPTKPCVVSVVGEETLRKPRAVQVQFRYAFVCDEDGVKVLDVTELAQPKPVCAVPMREAKNIYIARNYAYVAAGCDGLVILDVTNPESPQPYLQFNAGGCINDTHDVKLGVYYASQFAFLADGKNGVRVIQLTSPETPGYDGFLPRPVPKLIGTYVIPKGGEALAVSKGVDRDRAVDECGNQISVFGRVGARPLNLEEQRRLYLGPDGRTPYKVLDAVRDYGINGRRPREIDLHRKLEQYYGESLHPTFLRQ